LSVTCDRSAKVQLLMKGNLFYWYWWNLFTVYKLSFHINQWKELVCWKYVFCFSMHYIHKLLIHHLSIGGWFKRIELIEVKSLIWAQKGKFYIIYENVMWIGIYSLFINFLFISINEKNWFAESMFFVGVHWMEFVSQVKFRQLQTQR
jgi:hypothetical protein